MSSIAADAGYVVLIPLAGAAFLSLGRNPLAGLALGFAAVGGAFNVNMLIKPLDAVLTEITNDAIHMVDPSKSIGLTAGLWFSMASVLLLTVVIARGHRTHHRAAPGQIRRRLPTAKAPTKPTPNSPTPNIAASSTPSSRSSACWSSSAC